MMSVGKEIFVKVRVFEEWILALDDVSGEGILVKVRMFEEWILALDDTFTC